MNLSNPEGKALMFLDAETQAELRRLGTQNLDFLAGNGRWYHGVSGQDLMEGGTYRYIATFTEDELANWDRKPSSAMDQLLLLAITANPNREYFLDGKWQSLGAFALYGKDTIVRVPPAPPTPEELANEKRVKLVGMRRAVRTYYRQLPTMKDIEFFGETSLQWKPEDRCNTFFDSTIYRVKPVPKLLRLPVTENKHGTWVFDAPGGENNWIALSAQSCRQFRGYAYGTEVSTTLRVPVKPDCILWEK